MGGVGEWREEEDREKRGDEQEERERMRGERKEEEEKGRMRGRGEKGGEKGGEKIQLRCVDTTADLAVHRHLLFS